MATLRPAANYPMLVLMIRLTRFEPLDSGAGDRGTRGARLMLNCLFTVRGKHLITFCQFQTADDRAAVRAKGRECSSDT